MTQITIDLPDKLMSRLNSLPTPIADLVIKAVENYLKSETCDITQTETWKLRRSLEITQPETWKLRRSLEISQPDPKYIVGQDEKNEIITNYAEKIDEILYS